MVIEWHNITLFITIRLEAASTPNVLITLIMGGGVKVKYSQMDRFCNALQLVPGYPPLCLLIYSAFLLLSRRCDEYI